jgi:Sec-independent protein secretion pathway component TatC
MSLGDHLEELRARLILVILGLAVTLIVCLAFGKWIISPFSTRLPFTIIDWGNEKLVFSLLMIRFPSINKLSGSLVKFLFAKATSPLKYTCFLVFDKSVS